MTFRLRAARDRITIATEYAKAREDHVQSILDTVPDAMIVIDEQAVILSFSAAAERLNTTQPAVSARMRELEQRLGTALFRREGRQVQLTDVNLQTQGRFSSAADLSGASQLSASLKQLWLLTYREAQTQTYGDTFLMIMLCFIIATAMVPLMRKVQPPAAPSADAH